MVTFLPEARPRETFGSRLGNAVGEGITTGYQKAEQEEKKSQALQRLTGQDLRGLPDEYKQLAFQANLKQKQATAKTAAELQSNRQQLRALEIERGLDEGSLEPYASDVAMAERVSRPAKKTQASQPIDPEQQEKINKVRAKPGYDEMDDVESYEALTNAGVSRENSEAESKLKGEKAKRKQKTAEKQRAEELLFHKESEDVDKQLLSHHKSAEKQLSAIADVEKALKSKNVKPGSAANLLRGLGPVGEKIANAVLNEDEATVLALTPEFLEGRKELFGVRLSDADLALLKDKLPDIGKSVEANKAILKIFKRYATASKLRYQIGTDLKKENKGLRPLGYADKIEERLGDMMQPVSVINPKTGRTIEIPAYQLGDAMQKGAKLANE